MEDGSHTARDEVGGRVRSRKVHVKARHKRQVPQAGIRSHVMWKHQFKARHGGHDLTIRHNLQYFFPERHLTDLISYIPSLHYSPILAFG